MHKDSTVAEIVERNNRANDYLSRKKEARAKRDMWTLIGGMIGVGIVYGIMVLIN